MILDVFIEHFRIDTPEIVTIHRRSKNNIEMLLFLYKINKRNASVLCIPYIFFLYGYSSSVV